VPAAATDGFSRRSDNHRIKLSAESSGRLGHVRVRYGLIELPTVLSPFASLILTSVTSVTTLVQVAAILSVLTKSEEESAINVISIF